MKKILGFIVRLVSTLAVACVVIVALVPLYFGLAFVGLVPAPPFNNSCTTRAIDGQAGIDGLSFEFTETICDPLARNDTITIFVSAMGGGKKTAIFEYEADTRVMPVVEATGPNAVSISLPSIQAAVFSANRWQDVTVTYRIGRIARPGKNDPVSPLH